MSDITKVEPTPLAAVHGPADVADYMPKLLEVSMSPQFNVAAFDTLVAFAREQQARYDRERFDAALRMFADRKPKVSPDRRSRHKRKVLNDKGVWYEADAFYPSFERLQETLDPVLAECGLVARFRDKVVDLDKGIVSIACVLVAFGCSTEPARASFPIVSPKNKSGDDAQTIQEQIMTAETYARKSAYEEATGAVTADGWDQDMAGPGVRKFSDPSPPITESNLADLDESIRVNAERTGYGVAKLREKMHKEYGVTTDSELTVDQFRESIARLGRMKPKGGAS